MKNYDSIIIGTGQSTYVVVSGLRARGQKIAVVEADRFGGTCLNFGCTPTKTIVASARAAHMARRGADYGVTTGPVEIDFPRVMERQNSIRDEGTKGFGDYLKKNCDVYQEWGSFEGPNEVRVGDEVIRGETIYIHTGARARLLNLPGLNTIDYLDNKSILDLKERPEHLIIVGGSYIALEFGQAFRRLGSKVTILQRGPEIMTKEDPDVAKMVHEVFEREGIDIICNADVQAFTSGDSTTSPGGVTVELSVDGKPLTVSGSHVLLAVGRVPNSDKLNLEAAGVKTDERGFIEVNDRLQTSAPHIYALGDVNGRGAFTHTSVNDGEIIVHNLDGADWTVSDRIQTYGMFVDPPLGRVGMNEQQARASGRRILQGTMPMSRISRAKEKDETDGVAKILVDAESDMIVGATILGVGGDEIVNMITAWMYSGLPCKNFRRAVLIHPTVAELMPWVLDNLSPLE